MHSICLLRWNGAPSFACAQEMADYPPKYFQWQHSTVADPVRTVYLDQHIMLAAQDDVLIRIGILLESRALRPWHYETALALRGCFRAIFTYDKEWLDMHGAPFRFYPFGGSCILEQGMFAKERPVSMIVGNKTELPGHKLRHEIMNRLGNHMDIYGYPELYHPKTGAIRPYYFSIIIENSWADYWFSEKLIDCFSQGTMPIYWGCPGIGDFFDTNGMLTFRTVDELEAILSSISPELYWERYNSLQLNFQLAQQYRVPEDWLYEHNPDLFGEL